MKTETFCLPGTDIGRSLVNIKKVKNTPKQYPRKAGIPSKNPCNKTVENVSRETFSAVLFLTIQSSESVLFY